MRYTNNIILFFLMILIILLLIKNRKQVFIDNFKVQEKNILGNPISSCSFQGKTTGYYRDGYCSTGPSDTGKHVVCAVVDDEFLEFTKSKGNDLTTPQDSFPGLVAGDKWCVCALRWKEAYDANKAPKIIPEATNEESAKYISKNILFDKQT